MRFQHVVVVGLGWLLAVVVGCTSAEPNRTSGISNFVPSFVFDSKSESPGVVEQESVAEPTEIVGSTTEDPEVRNRTSLQEMLPKFSRKRMTAEPLAELHGPDVTAPLTEKEKAERGGAERPKAAPLKSWFRIGKPRIAKVAKFRTRSVQANEEGADEFRSIDAELEGLYASDTAIRGLDALLADADAMSELDSFADDSAPGEMIVLRATPDASAFQPSDQTAQASLSLIQPRDRGFEVSNDVSIRSLPFAAGEQEPEAIELNNGLPASSLSWREQLQKYPVTQDQKSHSVATLIQPKQTELRVLRMTAVTPQDRSVQVSPQVSIRSIGSPAVVRGVHPDVPPSDGSAATEFSGQLPLNRRVYSTKQNSQEKTLNR